MAGEPTRPRALILQHEEPSPPGYVAVWLRERGADVNTVRIDVDERLLDPAEHDVIVSLGSEFAAFDDDKPFVGRELDLVRRAVDADVPVLGLCFGGQMLARAAGGEGFRGQESEIGWLPVRSRDAELIPDGPWFQWHFDSFTVPPGATLLAESDVGPQAFVVGRSLGLQFHPEVTVEIMESWVETYRHELDADGVSPDDLLEETKQRATENTRSARQLFDHFWTDIAKLDGIDGRR
jgi:GMP synthase-like glutamine amidotransferase